MMNKFDDSLGQKKGNCDCCRATFYHDLEIYVIKFDLPKEGLSKILSNDEKIRLCRKCYSSIKPIIDNTVFKKQ